MDPHEAAIYGDDALELLKEAKRVLCKKYDVSPNAPIVVEIFPEQKDFAIRTFGLPGGAGFLGVCFGRVITANSPASQGDRPSNWRSVLWHEFCHVVTLEKTKNRMPRWLSEGISVYEERERDPSWGEAMTPTYREMLLADNLTPVSDLSAAFLRPPSPVHLQFAYYQSSLVVEFLIDRYGLDAVKAILDDLGNGLTINDALVRSVGSLDKLDLQFAEEARRRAEEFAPEADWSRDQIPEKPTPADLLALVKLNPTSYWGLRKLSQAYMAAGEFEKAKETLEKIDSMKATTGERGDPLELLGQVYGELELTKKERQTLENLVALSSDALPALRRLIELAREDGSWEQVAAYAEKINSINPLLPEGHLALAEAAEEVERPGDVVNALRALSKLEPADPAGLDYRMAVALNQLDETDRAKHHVLRALDEAPRYRQAHRLLLEIYESDRDAEKQEKASGDVDIDNDTDEDEESDADAKADADAEAATDNGESAE